MTGYRTLLPVRGQGHLDIGHDCLVVGQEAAVVEAVGQHAKRAHADTRHRRVLGEQKVDALRRLARLSKRRVRDSAVAVARRLRHEAREVRHAAVIVL